MTKARIAVLVSLLMTVPVWADSVVSYELLLGGDNHADSIKAGTRVAYSGGNATDGVVYDAGVLNWATNIYVTGNHSQSGHPSDGLPTQGVANFVFNLRLETDTGTLVTDVDYYSSVHDGTGGLDCSTCEGGYTIPGGTPFCAGAAFAFSFDIVGWGPGRVFEAISSGVYTGPYMEVAMYPTVDINNTSGDGQLLGIGAGYGQWSRGGGFATLTSKGVGISVAEGGFGVGPVVEGQIDTSLLPAGTYVLKLTPGTGTNVLRGDVDLVTAPGTGQPEVQAFAVPANSVLPEEITFVIQASATAPVLTACQSVKTHDVDELALDLALDSTVVEPRQNGPTKLVATFDQDIQGTGGLGIEDVTVSDGTVTNVSIAGNALTIELSGVADNQALTVGFPGIESTGGLASTDSICVYVMLGDTNSDFTINVLDLVVVRNELGLAVTNANCGTDVNADGTVNVLDLVLIRNVLGNIMTSVCP